MTSCNTNQGSGDNIIICLETASTLSTRNRNAWNFPLAASMVSGFGPVYLTTPLSTEPKSNGIVCHALVVRLAPCSIVVPFSPAQGDSLAANFRINPSGGNYQVLPNH